MKNSYSKLSVNIFNHQCLTMFKYVNSKFRCTMRLFTLLSVFFSCNHLPQWLPTLLSVLFLYVSFYCLELHQEIWVRFRASKTGLSPHHHPQPHHHHYQLCSCPPDHSKAVAVFLCLFVCITKTCLFKYIENFTHKKLNIFR